MSGSTEPSSGEGSGGAGEESSTDDTASATAGESTESDAGDSSGDETEGSDAETGSTSGETTDTGSTGDESTDMSSDADESSTGEDSCQVAVCLANNANATYDDSRYVTSGWAAYRMRGDASPHVIVGVEIFTGEVSASSALKLWSAPNGGLPNEELAAETFGIQPMKGWQGVYFDTGVAIAAGEYFWVAWLCVDGAQATITANGTGIPHSWRHGDTGPWNLDGTRNAMIRVYCCDP